MHMKVGGQNKGLILSFYPDFQGRPQVCYFIARLSGLWVSGILLSPPPHFTVDTFDVQLCAAVSSFTGFWGFKLWCSHLHRRCFMHLNIPLTTYLIFYILSCPVVSLPLFPENHGSDFYLLLIHLHFLVFCINGIMAYLISLSFTNVLWDYFLLHMPLAVIFILMGSILLYEYATVYLFNHMWRKT